MIWKLRNEFPCDKEDSDDDSDDIKAEERLFNLNELEEHHLRWASTLDYVTNEFINGFNDSYSDNWYIVNQNGSYSNRVHHVDEDEYLHQVRFYYDIGIDDPFRAIIEENITYNGSLLHFSHHTHEGGFSGAQVPDLFNSNYN